MNCTYAWYGAFAHVLEKHSSCLTMLDAGQIRIPSPGQQGRRMAMPLRATSAFKERESVMPK